MFFFKKEGKITKIEHCALALLSTTTLKYENVKAKIDYATQLPCRMTSNYIHTNRTNVFPFSLQVLALRDAVYRALIVCLAE